MLPLTGGDEGVEREIGAAYRPDTCRIVSLGE